MFNSMAGRCGRDDAETIDEMTRRFVAAVDPLKVYIFGSFASGTYTDDSDYDFYIVVDDSENLYETNFECQKSIFSILTRPVDIIVRHDSFFSEYGPLPATLFVEGDVYRKGILLYEKEKTLDERITA